MGGTLDPATDPLQQTVGDTGGTVSGAVQTAGDSVQTATQTVQQTVDDPVQTATQTVQQTVNDPVQTSTQTVQQTVDDPVQAVGQATGGTDPVTTATQSVTNTVQSAADAVQPAAGAVGDATQQAGSSVLDTTAATAGAVETTAKNGGGTLLGAGESVHSTGDQIAAAGTPLSEKVTTLVSGTGAPVPTDVVPTDVAPAIPSHLPEQVTAAPPGLTGTTPPVPTGDGGNGGLLGGLPFHAPGFIPGGDEVLMATAAAITVTTIAIAIRPSTVATAEFVLANVRQIPVACAGVRAGVGRRITAAAAGSAHFVELAADAPGRASAALDDMSRALRDGFQHAYEGALPGADTGGSDDGERDIRLLMQIGMLLGTVYVAFLTVWFWATRLRWNPRT
jgi:hypothetical protein